ncbi:hypothetical protein OG866_26990 [Streptomyces sp. NBC_00663]|uniref:hypothetical protein n=1 Tax=Streptomyces sp. NBC_00663 TaxID=2975801 RepID=UPI002E3542C6|nr:hypothetical protein [Streptomyces sp. NBC_00663]
MSLLPAPAAEPRHSRGGAGGAARGQDEPSWYRQKVKVPRRLWDGGGYSAGAVAYWAQITALAHREDGCRASVARLAEYLGDAKRTAERCLAELSAPGPDGEPELSTVRRTRSDGDGETAERRTRPVTRAEQFALVPVLAAKVMRRPQFVLYCALAWAVATSAPVTAAELAGLLGVTERSARRLVDELEALGWVTVHRRAGAHGRHLYDVHDLPLRLVDEPEPGPDTDGGSGACTDGGSLAIKEDPRLTDERSTGAGGSSAVGEVTVSGSAPVDNSPSRSVTSVPDTFLVAARTAVRPAERPPYDGPGLSLSPRVWAVLEPVHDLLHRIRPFVLRRIGREIGRQLDDGIWAEDIRDQLTRLRVWTPAEDLRDPGRWLLGAALPARSLCGLPGCYWGFQHHTGFPCKACAEAAAARARDAHPPHTAWHECRACRAPSRQPLPADLCRTCRPA